ncbi:MAG: hypothetical protein IJ411_00630, partial [Oscillospiraceae bacterium]|nr:hypothetical protein [Oscillospiraceae bacterium]
ADGLALGMYRADGGLEVAWDTHLYGDVIGRVLGLGGLPKIPSGGDANDYRTPGVYGIGSNAIAATISNLPFQEAGTITVRSGLGDGRTDGVHLYLYQDYINFLGQNRRTRWMRTGETAGEWTYGGWTTL